MHAGTHSDFYGLFQYLANIKSKLTNFSDIVDLDDEAFEDRRNMSLIPLILIQSICIIIFIGVSTDYVTRFIDSNYFKLFMTAVILVRHLIHAFVMMILFC